MNAICIQKAESPPSDPRRKIGELVVYADTAHLDRTLKEREEMNADEFRKEDS